MRILLLGEFSGLHNNLKDGLQELGHEVVLAACGDGFKKFPSDISFDSNKQGYLGKIERLFKYYINLKKLVDYDIVQIINPIVFSTRLNLNTLLIRYIISHNASSSLLGAGSDAFFWSKTRYKMRYGPFDDTLKYDYESTSHPVWDEKKMLQWNMEVASKVDHIIPVMYEYESGYENFPNLKKCIPLPINIKKIQYDPNEIGDKITIFHGLNRYGFKGTRFVQEAFNTLEGKYSNDLRLIIKGKLPITDYLKLMRNTNAVIDQVFSYSCGMNALYALAMGKIVLGGAELESLQALGILTTPVINIEPSKESIIKEIEYLLDSRAQFKEMGEASRFFVEKNHSHIDVAKKYLNTWGSV